ncbi:HD domain-containing protein [candidate division KSB1 bacterium]|nr:HD domain-containing protein [candidate division KSB1 bacterium]
MLNTKEQREKILVVDDDINNCKLCEETLSLCGYEVSCAIDSAEAIKIVGTRDIDLVIADSKISDVNEQELLIELRKISPQIAVIVMNALQATETDIDAAQSGGYSYLSKPLHFDTIITAVKKSLEKQHLLNEITRLNTLSSLFRAAEKINRTPEVSQVLKTMVKSVISETNSDKAAIFYPDEETGRLYLHYAVNFETEPDSMFYLRQVQEIAQKAFQHEKSLLFNRQTTESPLRENILAIPMRSNARILGVLSVLKNSDSGNLSDDDRDVAAYLCTQASMALNNAELTLDLEIYFLESMKTLAKIIDERDKFTHGHSRRVSRIAVLIGQKMGLAERDLDNLSYTGILHDIGKIGICDEILLKPGPLTKEEYEIVKTHPERGYNILKPIKKLAPVCDAIFAHHEWYDGRGYPRGLRKNQIPSAASIISVADAYDSITSERIYRSRRSHRDALKILCACAGTQFHPEVVDEFLTLDESELRR